MIIIFHSFLLMNLICYHGNFFVHKKMADLKMEKQLEESFVTLQHYFSPSRKQEGTGNPAQLVLFAEHATKVS